MKYEKPEITQLAPAIKAVQLSQDKNIHDYFDQSELASQPAYSADE